jgi:hypothetical protein
MIQLSLSFVFSSLHIGGAKGFSGEVTLEGGWSAIVFRFGSVLVGF